jgi:hypothetical protein
MGYRSIHAFLRRSAKCALAVCATRSGADPAEPIAQLLHEQTIVPEQIAAYKVTLHRQWMQDWVRNNTVQPVKNLRERIEAVRVQDAR